MRRTVPVKDIETGETWPSVKAAAEALDVAPPNVTQAIQKHRAVRGHWLAYATGEAYCRCCKEKLIA